MNKIAVVYYSFTGNTMRMVSALEKGLVEAGADYKIFKVMEMKEEDREIMFASDIIAMASPANEREEIHKLAWQPFMAENGERFKDKRVYLFGSYGWGEGVYLKNWKKQLEELGAEIVAEAILSNGNPKAEEKEKLFEMGKKLVYI
ncbi:MAG: flavodoxin domain-containing protein [Fusobacterium sp.]|uniref:flavodoxin domain-containing protein n=1 Tax=Fusobacterium sp. TaxID=68766 RepID=UPI0026DCF678|nr:flavodoxin domain-containing protein [Fusobacterium sp.]MDO4689760.1 flavodoxin domain-containing protein [Fusobacterium sp.]